MAETLRRYPTLDTVRLSAERFPCETLADGFYVNVGSDDFYIGSIYRWEGAPDQWQALTMCGNVGERRITYHSSLTDAIRSILSAVGPLPEYYFREYSHA